MPKIESTQDVHVSVPFSPGQHEALKVIAKREKRSKAGQVRVYCEPYLDAESKFLKPRKSSRRK